MFPPLMALHVEDAAAECLIRALADETGESVEHAVMVAVHERLERVRHAASVEARKQELTRIALRAAAMPVLDDRTADEILGYDEDGLPT